MLCGVPRDSVVVLRVLKNFEAPHGLSGYSLPPETSLKSLQPSCNTLRRSWTPLQILWSQMKCLRNPSETSPDSQTSYRTLENFMEGRTLMPLPFSLVAKLWIVNLETMDSMTVRSATFSRLPGYSVSLSLLHNIQILAMAGNKSPSIKNYGRSLKNTTT